MKKDIISIICLLIGYVLYPCVLMRDGFNWTTAILAFELIVMSVAIIPVIVKCCKK